MLKTICQATGAQPLGLMQQLMPPMFIVGTIFALITNRVLWCRMKFILREHGYPTSFYHSHYRDFGEMRKLIRTETDPVLRRSYSLILTWSYISLAIFLSFCVGLFYVLVHGSYAR